MLVKALHPDRHGDPIAAVRLAAVNVAYRTLTGPPSTTAAATTAATTAAAAAATTAATTAATVAAATGAGGGSGGDGEEVGAETVTFTVEEFRPVVFEALVVASGDLGDVTDSDDPFSLDLSVDGGFCHLELVPEAGGSVVTVDSEQVDVGAVGAALVVSLLAMGLRARWGG